MRWGVLRDAPLLLLQEQTRTGALLRDHFRKAAFEPKVVLDSGSFEVLKRCLTTAPVLRNFDPAWRAAASPHCHGACGLPIR